MDESIARLMGMGFEFDFAINALEASNNDESLALQYLLEGFPDANRSSNSFNVRQNHKPKATKSKSKKDDSLISWIDGRDKIINNGVKPFFDRIETAFSDNNQTLPKQRMIPKDVYIYCYDLIFTMCIQREPHNHSAAMYKLHEECLRDYFHDIILKQLDTCRHNMRDGHNDIQYIEAFTTSYKKCMIAIKGLHTIFHYLNRFYVPNTEDTMTIDASGMLLYFNTIFEVHSKYAIHIIFKYVALCRDYKLSNGKCLSYGSGHSLSYDYYKIKELISEYVHIVTTLNKELSKDKTGNVDASRRALEVKINRLLPYGFMHEITGVYSLYVPTVISTLIVKYYDKFDALSIYQQYFERMMQVETRRFYHNKCQEMVKMGVTMTQYVNNAELYVEYEGNTAYDMCYIVRELLYNAKTFDSVWKLDAVHRYSSLVDVHKYAMDRFKLLLTLKDNYCVIQWIVHKIKYDMRQVFNYYVICAKKNVSSKDMHIKYAMVYDSCFIYKEITNVFYGYHCNDIKFKSMIKNEFYSLCAQFMRSELHFICELLSSFVHYMLINSERIGYEIDIMMDFIGFLYRLMYFVGLNSNLFFTRYRYYWLKRVEKHKLTHKRFYFEHKMIEKLQCKQLPQWMDDILQTGGRLRVFLSLNKN